MEKVGKFLRAQLVGDIKEGLKTRNNTFLLAYTSVSASQFNDLRKDLKKIGADMVVSKNRLAQIALQEVNQEQLGGHVEGQIALIWSNADAVTISKLLKNFSGKHESVKVRGGIVDGAYLAQNDIDRLAELPSREVLLSQLLQVILAPLTRFAGSLNAKSQDLLSILKQLSEKKGGS